MRMKMRRKILILLLLLLLFLLLSVAPSKDSGDSSGKDSDLKCSLRTEAEPGKDVTLDCYCEPRCHVTHEELKWKFNQKTFVLAYRGHYYLNQQDDQFKGRAHLTSTERLKDGSFPLTISTVSERDEGTYTCHVGSKTCSVELQSKVDKGAREDEKTSARVQGSNSPTTTGQLPHNLGYLGFIALFVPAIIVFVCWKKIKKKCAKSSEGL